MTLTAHLVAEAAQEDAAYVALRDLSEAMSHGDASCIIGGQMVALLAAALPSAGTIERFTGDADGGIPVEAADDGSIHTHLIDAGYEPESGNRYLKTGHEAPVPTIDILVPRLDGRFAPTEHGGRAYDGVPGLEVALASRQPIHVTALLTNGTELEFDTHVPVIEAAVILKAYAWSTRPAAMKDDLDLYTLLTIVDARGYEATGWHLHEEERASRGSRLDAARHLHRLASQSEVERRATRYQKRHLTLLIRRHVHNPG